MKTFIDKCQNVCNVCNIEVDASTQNSVIFGFLHKRIEALPKRFVEFVIKEDVHCIRKHVDVLNYVINKGTQLKHAKKVINFNRVKGGYFVNEQKM